MEAEAKAGNAMGVLKADAKRERTWDECGIEEKINRLRETMLTLASQAQFAGAHAHEALKIAKAHQHGARGEVMLSVIEQFEQLGNLVGQGGYGAHPFEHVRRMLG